MAVVKKWDFSLSSIMEGWHDWEKEGKPDTKKNSWYAEYGSYGPGAVGPRVKWAKKLKQ